MSRRLAMLWMLYFVQGLPFGFQATAVPVLLREGGASLTVISLAGLVSAPWILKPLWAPWVDASPRRKTWLLPMQGLLAGSVALGGFIGDSRTAPLLAAVGLMNLFAATLDIAVDGLAVDILDERDLGLGNAAQVVGYKLGMLTGGGLLLWVSARIGHASSMYAMALSIAVTAFITWRFAEPTPESRARREPLRYRATLRALVRTLAAPRARWLGLAVLTYKLGESVADAMFKPFLVDAAFTRAQIGLWLGTWGMLFSLLGSLGGGWLASRWRLWQTLTVLAALRILPLVGEWWLVGWAAPSSRAVIAVTSAEHFFGGALTTAMFAMMMSRVDRNIGATHFTALAALEVVGKAVPSLAAGALTDALGYRFAFGLAVALSTAFLFVLPPLRGGPSRRAAER